MIGKTFSHYRITGKLGEGGMGIVYRARDESLDREVAIKVLPEEVARNAERLARFDREAKAIAALRHPNIVTIHSVEEDGGARFIIMELLEGRSLQQYIGGKPMPVDTAIGLAIEVADALNAAHAKGVIHRDIKPANIFVTDHGHAEVLDFGLAKLASVPARGSTPDDATLTVMDMTSPGVVVGTASYMSPEQSLGKDLDHRTDIFSLGVVLYEMVTGRRAFEGSTSAAVFDGILNRAPESAMQLNRDVPPELNNIIGRALEKDPDLRYQTATGMRADLIRLRRDSSSGQGLVTPPTSSGRSRKRMLGAAAALMVLTAMFFVLWGLPNNDPAQEAATDKKTSQVPSRGPRIAVMPFANASGDPDQEYFSIGLTEDIIRELSRHGELSVIGYRGTEVDVRTIGESHQARYVLHGSVRKDGQRIRVSVQLSGGEDGRSVWANSYIRDLTASDLFELQDELTQHVVNAIAGSYGALTRAELPGARHRPPASLDSYDCVLRVYEYLHVHIAENHLSARDCLEGVIGDDANYSEGRAWLAYLYAEQYHHRRNERAGEDDILDRALEMAEEAVRLDTSNQVAHGTLALVLFFRGEYERAKTEADRTVQLNPNNELWLNLMGLYLIQQEEFEQGVPMVRKSVQINPNPPGWIRMAFFHDHYHHGRYEEALAELKDISLRDDFRLPLFFAATYGQLGLQEPARKALDEFLHLWERPVEEIRQEMIERNAYSPDLTERLMEGLEKAGLN
jgi:non-specific serine/threonine protein kinase